jgi:beta-glucosidase-like glycosyl hydrolase
MISFSSLNGEQMHGHRRLIEDVLRGELGFKGLLVSDWGACTQCLYTLPLTDQVTNQLPTPTYPHTLD